MQISTNMDLEISIKYHKYVRQLMQNLLGDEYDVYFYTYEDLNLSDEQCLMYRDELYHKQSRFYDEEYDKIQYIMDRENVFVEI